VTTDPAACTNGPDCTVHPEADPGYTHEFDGARMYPLAEGGIVSPSARIVAEDDPPALVMPVHIELHGDADADLKARLLEAMRYPQRLVSRPSLDTEALYTAVDRQRRTRRIYWRDVAAEAGVSASGLTRLGHGHRPDADCLVRLLVWLGTTDLAAFIAQPTTEETTDGHR
jgi:hypothetical protein